MANHTPEKYTQADITKRPPGQTYTLRQLFPREVLSMSDVVYMWEWSKGRYVGSTTYKLGKRFNTHCGIQPLKVFEDELPALYILANYPTLDVEDRHFLRQVEQICYTQWKPNLNRQAPKKYAVSGMAELWLDGIHNAKRCVAKKYMPFADLALEQEIKDITTLVAYNEQGELEICRRV